MATVTATTFTALALDTHTGVHARGGKYATTLSASGSTDIVKLCQLPPDCTIIGLTANRETGTLGEPTFSVRINEGSASSTVTQILTTASAAATVVGGLGKLDGSSQYQVSAGDASVVRYAHLELKNLGGSPLTGTTNWVIMYRVDGFN